MSVRRPNRIKTCPCGGKLMHDKHPCISESGFAYRKRRCSKCKGVIYTKQPPEEITLTETNAAFAALSFD